MPQYKIRLESPDSFMESGDPHFRLTSLVADDEDAARLLCERMEYRKAAHQLDDAALTALEDQEAEAVERGVKVDAQTRMRLAIHRQAKPYAVVDVQEIG